MNGYSYASELIPQIGQIYSLSINNKISLFMIAAPIVDFISKRDAFIVKVTPAIYSEPPYDLQSVIHDNFHIPFFILIQHINFIAISDCYTKVQKKK